MATWPDFSIKREATPCSSRNFSEACQATSTSSLPSSWLAILYSPHSPHPVEMSTSKPYGVILPGRPCPFLPLLFPETLILITCFSLPLLSFPHLKGPVPFLGLCAWWSACLRAAEACWAGDVSGVIPAVLCNPGMPLYCQLSCAMVL